MKVSVIMTATVLIPWLMATVTGEPPVMTAREIFAWSFVVSLCAGAAAALRDDPKELVGIVRVGLNTAVMGTCVSMVGYKWTADDPASAWLVIGTCGILSMGGIASINWVVDAMKRKLDRNYIPKGIQAELEDAEE